MLDTTIKTQLKAYLGRLQQPVELVASLDERLTLIPKPVRERIAAFSTQVDCATLPWK